LWLLLKCISKTKTLNPLANFKDDRVKNIKANCGIMAKEKESRAKKLGRSM